MKDAKICRRNQAGKQILYQEFFIQNSKHNSYFFLRPALSQAFLFHHPAKNLRPRGTEIK
jgi:hypothetical protein